MSEPRPRSKVYNTYWKFAAERQRIFRKRVAGEPAPWTQDPVLEEFKFCNVYRASDRVSQYMIRHVCYNAQRDSAADRLFQIVAFRTFSKPELWDYVTQRLGHAPRLDDLENGRFGKALDAAKESGRTLYTAAFILCANNAYGMSLKHRNHVALFQDMFLNHETGDRIKAASSLEDVYSILHEFPLMGDFMSYQTAIDLNYSRYCNFSENDFTMPGPGAMRGLAKVFQDLGTYTPQEAIQWMVDRQADEFNRLGIDFEDLWGRPLHAIDCQGLFCEVDKYSRVAFPELASNRKRIKARFQPNPKPVPLFFPPKWHIKPSSVRVPEAIRVPQVYA